MATLPPADDGHGMARNDGRVAGLFVGLHQVHAGQVLVGGVDAAEGFAGDVL